MFNLPFYNDVIYTVQVMSQSNLKLQANAKVAEQEKLTELLEFWKTSNTGYFIVVPMSSSLASCFLCGLLFALFWLRQAQLQHPIRTIAHENGRRRHFMLLLVLLLPVSSW